MTGFAHALIKKVSNVPCLKPQTNVYLQDLIVGKAFRSRGTGTALMAAVKHYGEEHGAEFVRLQVFPANKDGIRFYKANGFHETVITMECALNQRQRRQHMKRELGIARCGLACCLCSENITCTGCNSGTCPDKEWCVNRACSLEKGIARCSDCAEDCRKGLLTKIKPYAFTLFIKRYGLEELLDCLERNEKAGIVYHRTGITGDYDDFDDVEKLIGFIRTGKR